MGAKLGKAAEKGARFSGGQIEQTECLQLMTWSEVVHIGHDIYKGILTSSGQRDHGFVQHQ